MNKATYAFDQFEHYPHAFQPILDNDTSVPFFPKDPLDIVQEGSFVEVRNPTGLFEINGEHIS